MKLRELRSLFGNLQQVGKYCVEGVGMWFVLLHDPQEKAYFLGPNGYGFLALHLKCEKVPDAVLGISQVEHPQEMIIGIRYGSCVKLYCRVADQWNFQADLELPADCERVLTISRDWEGTGIWLLVSYEDAEKRSHIAKYNNEFKII